MDKVEERLTVKEWAKKAGINLINYDGFVEIYSKLANQSLNELYTSIAARMSDAGDLICTRRAFEVCLNKCTIKFPTVSELERMADVVPYFAESNIDRHITLNTCNIENMTKNQKKGNIGEEPIKKLIEILKIKKTIRQKSLDMSGHNRKRKIKEIDRNRLLKSTVREALEKYKGTVEDIEEKLIDEALKELEMANRKNDLNKIPFEKLKLLSNLYFFTERAEEYNITKEELESDFAYIQYPGQERDDLTITYTVLDGNEATTGVAFRYQTDEGKTEGAMHTSKEVDKRIREKLGIGENPLTEDNKVEESLQIIDAQVSTSQRKNLFKRIKEFMQRIFGPKDEGRE